MAIRQGALHPIDVVVADLRLADPKLDNVELARTEIDRLTLDRQLAAAIASRPHCPGSTTTPSKPSARTSSARIAPR